MSLGERDIIVKPIEVDPVRIPNGVDEQSSNQQLTASGQAPKIPPTRTIYKQVNKACTIVGDSSLVIRFFARDGLSVTT